MGQGGSIFRFFLEKNSTKTIKHCIYNSILTIPCEIKFFEKFNPI